MDAGAVGALGRRATEGRATSVAEPRPRSPVPPATLQGPNLDWVAGVRLVFNSYQDDWPHLYAVSAAGGAPPLLLTPGAFMVEHVAEAAMADS